MFYKSSYALFRSAFSTLRTPSRTCVLNQLVVVGDKTWVLELTVIEYLWRRATKNVFISATAKVYRQKGVDLLTILVLYLMVSMSYSLPQESGVVSIAVCPAGTRDISVRKLNKNTIDM